MARYKIIKGITGFLLVCTLTFSASAPSQAYYEKRGTFSTQINAASILPAADAGHRNTTSFMNGGSYPYYVVRNGRTYTVNTNSTLTFDVYPGDSILLKPSTYKYLGVLTKNRTCKYIIGLH